VPFNRPTRVPGEAEALADAFAADDLDARLTQLASTTAALVGREHAFLTPSCTASLEMAALALGVGPGDEVIVPSFSFAATANAVALTGATPVFADIETTHFCLDPDAVAAAVTPRTAAIMPVHLYGHPADLDRLGAIATRHGLALIEDAAQAHLAGLGDRPVGTFGAVAAFSFYPTKNITTGEGGLVVCADPEVARRVRLLRNQGMERRYANEIIGYNARMTDLQAAIGRVQLRRLPGITATRRSNADHLTAGLADLEDGHRLALPLVAPRATHAWHQYTVRVERRDEVAATLDALGVESGVYYPTPIHRLPSYRVELDLPATEAAARSVLSLPVHPKLTRSNLEHVVGALRKAVAG
jgi:dTDP-4-amino-4,6-dideoxygalactose transaminase